MGGEGGNWIGLAPFSGTKHIFQNMGDGTYYHSGLMAIRAAVASGVNITYKILYNDAVAMTGGQPVDGPISVAAIARQVRDEGVDTIVLLSDNPDAHRGNPDLPDKVRIGHRDELNDIQQELREVSGCTVLIYEQTCAAEKRRRRKRGLYPDPPKRLFISKEVCEGCGDCSVQSTCVSIAPVETQFGTKRQIDQSSCNKDYSCANGFCPSFITIEGAPPRKPARATMDAGLLDGLPPPDRRVIGHDSCNVMIAGIGGTGVITVAAVIGMAAHIDGLATSMFDMTGLAQKNGAVFSHVRMAASAENLHSQKLGVGEADLLIAFDLVAGASAEASVTLANDRTRALVNSDVTPTVAFQFNRDSSIDSSFLAKRLEQRVGADNLSLVDASAIATMLLGDVIGANMFLVGVAIQKGLLPVTVTAIEQAITLNATARDMNLRALALGRLYVADPARFASLMPRPVERRDPDLVAIVAARTSHLEEYQNAAYAQRYAALIERVRTAERAISTASEALSLAIAQNYGRLLGYKDEYEVARLLTSPSLYEEIARTFEGKAKLSFNLAPPILGGRPVNGRPRKRQFPAWAMRPILQLLAKAKFLRGTVMDPFGYSTERRAERRLIDEYEALVEDILRSLTPAALTDAVRLAGLASMIRGYGPVKEAAIIAYRTALREAKDQLDNRQSRGAKAA
jgi:indolepyruvate ferredoxin oxidoreductase